MSELISIHEKYNNKNIFILVLKKIIIFLFKMIVRCHKMFQSSFDTFHIKVGRMMESLVSKLTILILFQCLYLVCIKGQQDPRFQETGDLNSNKNWHREILDPKGRYLLEWVVDWEQERIIFNVAVATLGHVAFGLALSSNMEGADIVIGGVYPNGTYYFSDRHSIGNQKPILDQSQDWMLHSASESMNHTLLSFSRSFDTCDQNDIPFSDNVVYLLWAYGEMDSEMGEFPFENQGNFLMYLRDPDLTPRSIQEANQNATIAGVQVPTPAPVNDVEIWTVRETFAIPAKPTTYWCNIKTFRPPTPGKKHIIGYNVRMNAEGKRSMHHMLLYRCGTPVGLNPTQVYEPLSSLPGQECNNLRRQQGPIPTTLCTIIKIGYAIGGRPAFFPPHFGIPLEDEYYLLQVHYDNPQSRANMISDIQMDLYYTSNLRQNDAGIIIVGQLDPGVPTVLLPPGERDHVMYGHCAPSCTTKMLPAEGVKMTGGLLHAHLTGRGIIVRHFRNGVELPFVAYDENYQFNFQPLRIFREEKTVLPGDQLTTECIFDTRDKNTSTVGGYETSQEMCFAFLLHYNMLSDYPTCRSEIRSREYTMRYLGGTTSFIWSDARIEYVAISPLHLAGMTMSEISDSRYVNWDTELRSQLRRDHISHPQVPVCPSINEEEDIGDVLEFGTSPDYVTLPRIEGEEYSLPNRCAQKNIFKFKKNDYNM